MNNSSVRQMVKVNVYTTSEAAEYLNISKQKIIRLVKDGKLIPVKSSSQGMLFLLEDLESVRTQNHNTYKMPFLYDISSGLYSLEFFNNNIKFMDKIDSVFIYFNNYDAAIDGFYIPGQYVYKNFQCFKAPNMVIRDILGKEMWLTNVNCGYGGTGPSESCSILKQLGYDEQISESVYDYRVIKILGEPNSDNVQVCVGKDINDFKYDLYDTETTTKVALEEAEKYNEEIDINIIKSVLFQDIFTSIYFQEDHLVLFVKERRRGRLLNKMPPSIMLDALKRFIPNPVEVQILSEEEAENLGFTISFKNRVSYYAKEEFFNLIIKDLTGRQLWLNSNLDKKSIYSKSYKLYEFLENCGLELKSDMSSLDSNKWLNTILKKNINTTLPIKVSKK